MDTHNFPNATLLTYLPKSVLHCNDLQKSHLLLGDSELF